MSGLPHRAAQKGGDVKRMESGIYHADCLDVIKDMDDNSIDLLVTDPPYG